MLSPLVLSEIGLSSAMNFQTLIVFICNVFVGGHFRNGHILYDPKVFENNLTNHFESICPDQITWHLTDITKPSLLPWNIEDHTEHILQLIFFDSQNFTKEMDLYEEYHTFYRIFVFDSTNALFDPEKVVSEIRNRSSWFDSNTLIVFFSPANGDVLVKWTLKKDDVIFNSSVLFDPQSSDRNKFSTLFDQIFGEYDRMRSIRVNAHFFYWISGDIFQQYPTHRTLYLANYFSSVLNTKSIYLTSIFTSTTNNNFTRQFVMPDDRKSHNNDLIEVYTATKMIEETNDQPYNLHLSGILLSPAYQGKYKETIICPLYPHRDTKLVVMFVYGPKFTRRMNILLIPRSIQIIAGLIVLFVCLETYILYLIRRRLRLQRRDLVSTFIDILIAFISGGSIRIVHKFEKLFFGILLTGAFFIVSVFSGDLLDCFVRLLNEKVDTFDKLSNINPPIFLAPQLSRQNEQIQMMIRRKMGANSKYQGLLSWDSPIGVSGYAIVTDEFSRDKDIHVRNVEGVDFDLIQGYLGSIQSQFYISSNYVVFDHLKKKIDDITSSMMESGLYQFFESFADFRNKLYIKIDYLEATKGIQSQNNEDDDELQALTMEQLRRPMILIVCLWISAIVVFVVEIVISKWIIWQKRDRYRY